MTNRAWILAAGLLLAGCAAPLVLGAGTSQLQLDGFPDGTLAAEATTSDGVTLRGVHVPAGPGAPLVLHLLPSQASVTTGLRDFAGWRETLGVLREQGFASLALDYRGVGASEGVRDGDRLADDGRAMWAAALSRVGDDPGAVVLRGVSLGSLPMGVLVEQGARPGALVLMAPVDAGTVVANAARARHGALLGGLGGAFVRNPDVPSLAGWLGHAPVPGLVLVAADDSYLPPPERDAVVAAARAGGLVAEILPGDHLQLTLRAYGFELAPHAGRLVEDLLPIEREFLATYLADFQRRGPAAGTEPE